MLSFSIFVWWCPTLKKKNWVTYHFSKQKKKKIVFIKIKAYHIYPFFLCHFVFLSSWDYPYPYPTKMCHSGLGYSNFSSQNNWHNMPTINPGWLDRCKFLGYASINRAMAEISYILCIGWSILISPFSRIFYLGFFPHYSIRKWVLNKQLD